MPALNTAISCPFLIFTLLLVLNLSLTIDRSYAADTLLNINCSSIVYAPNSIYETNLNTLFASLKANATQNNYRFYNTTVVGISDGSDTVYGMFLCRGDDTIGDCRKCVANATQSVLQKCPSRPVAATVWYVDCMVRYSNESMFRVMNRSPAFFMKTHENMTVNVSGFMQLVGDTMRDLATEAAISAIRYATKEAKFTSFYTVYAVAQCTPDLSTDECQRCLTLANNHFPQCCYSNTGARVLTPSCNVRYELYPFYQLPPPPPPSPLPPPPPPSPSVTSVTARRTPPTGKKKSSNIVNIALIMLVSILVVLVCICIFLILRRGKKRLIDAGAGIGNYSYTMTEPPNFDYGVSGDLFNVESLQYDWTTLQTATQNFSEDNKLGEGGFGVVYKGVLANGREIAVKRLSTGSSQGAEQFKNEVVFVAKLQHRNLVKLLGFCLAGYEKLLVYEYVSNKSLDLFIFDPTRRTELNWPTRYNIIKGIARGVLYLHEDSRLRIIHRDLKASNILLDADLNPKISDFGMARNFNVGESPANTSRIAGTFGYMAPEYLLHGEFSVKSDVYGFGVLVLEIISGKKSSSFRQSRVDEHLLTYFWKQWREGTPLEMVDPCLGDSYTSHEVMRCIQLGLLCVQGDTEERPSMATVVFNLNSYSDLPVPEEPAFFINGKTRQGSVTGKLGLDKPVTNSMLLSFGPDMSVS